MPRVVVPTESEERASGSSTRRRKAVLSLLVVAGVLAAAGYGLRTWQGRAPKASADTVFVSAPAWPKPEARPVPPRPTLATKEFILQVGAYADKQDAQAMADRLIGLTWPVSIVVPVSARDSLNKVIVSGISDPATARRVADSLAQALGRKVTIIEPAGTRAK